MTAMVAVFSGCVEDADSEEPFVAEPEDLTYQTIKVDFIKIDVHDDADNWPNGEAELFFEFKVNNEIVLAVGPNNAVGVDSGESVSLNATFALVLPESPGANFSVYGSVSEDDDWFSGAVDNAGWFIHTYFYEQGWSPGNKSVRLTGDGLDVTVHYIITLV